MEFFFNDDVVQETVENHARSILDLEDDEAERIIKLYKNIRQDLRDRLDALSLRKNKFTAEHVRGVLVQVETAIGAMEEKLNKGMGSGAETAARFGVGHLVDEINKWNDHFIGAVNPIDVDTAVMASDASNFLMNRYESSIKKYSADVRASLTQAITEAAVAQTNYSDLIQDLSSWFMGEEWKLHRIVRTELHNAYGMGKLRAMNDLYDDGNGQIPDLMKTIYNPRDARTGKDSIYWDGIEKPISVDEFFEYRWQGKLRRFLNPPDRPNDRSILVPFIPQWKKS